MGPEMRTLISLEGAEWKAGVVGSEERDSRTDRAPRSTLQLPDGPLR